MNVPLTDGIGLRIYKELMHRESNCAAMWHVNYGPEALQKPPDPAMMMNLGQFTKRASVPMPLDVQRTLPTDLTAHLTKRSASCFDLTRVRKLLCLPILCVRVCVCASSPRAPQGEACTVGQGDALREGDVPKVVRRSGIRHVRLGLG